MYFTELFSTFKSRPLGAPTARLMGIQSWSFPCSKHLVVVIIRNIIIALGTLASFQLKVALLKKSSKFQYNNKVTYLLKWNDWPQNQRCSFFKVACLHNNVLLFVISSYHICLHIQNESFSSKWDLPSCSLPPSSLEGGWGQARQFSFCWKTLISIGHYSKRLCEGFKQQSKAM